MSLLECYKKSDCCGEDCDMLDSKDPCWGEVRLVDEWHWEGDHWWVHMCQGHSRSAHGMSYIRKSQDTKNAI
jgi:hypothetical protein